MSRLPTAPLGRPGPVARVAALATTLAVVAGCATGPGAGTPAEPRTATLTRTTHGVPHIVAPDLETLAYGVAYAHAQDNVCQTADHLVTVRGERSRVFGGGTASGQLGLRQLPNEQIDAFVAATLDDARLERNWAAASDDMRAMARGYVAGYNRFLADRAATLPVACRGQPWVRPMTESDFRRATEVLSMQAGLVALADAMLGARPPAPATSSA